jgi:hypothetical protein
MDTPVQVRPEEPTLGEASRMIDNHEDRIQMLEEVLIKAGLLPEKERLPILPLALAGREVEAGTAIFMRRVPEHE